MQDRVWRWSFVAVLAAIGAALWQAQVTPALAQGGSSGGCSTCVAVIDIDRVLGQLQEKGDREAELDAFRQELQDEIDGMLGELKQMESELKVIPKDTPEYEEAALRVLDARAAIDFKRQLAPVRLLEREKSITVALFNKISDGAQRYAEREGVDVLLSDDQALGLTNDLKAETVQARLLTKKIIFAKSHADITNDVATMLNNEYRAQP